MSETECGFRGRGALVHTLASIVEILVTFSMSNHYFNSVYMQEHKENHNRSNSTKKRKSRITDMEHMKHRITREQTAYWGKVLE